MDIKKLFKKMFCLGDASGQHFRFYFCIWFFVFLVGTVNMNNAAAGLIVCLILIVVIYPLGELMHFVIDKGFDFIDRIF